MSSIINHPVEISLPVPTMATVNSKQDEETLFFSYIEKLVDASKSFRLKWSQDSDDEDKPLLTFIEDVISVLPVDRANINSAHERIARNLQEDQKMPELPSAEQNSTVSKTPEGTSSSSINDSSTTKSSDSSTTNDSESDSELSSFSDGGSCDSFSTALDNSDEQEVPSKTTQRTPIPINLDTSNNPIIDVRREGGGVVATTRETPNGLGRHTRWSYPIQQRSLSWRSIVGIANNDVDTSVASQMDTPPPSIVQPVSVEKTSIQQSSAPTPLSKSLRKRSFEEVDSDETTDPPSPSRKIRTL